MSTNNEQQISSAFRNNAGIFRKWALPRINQSIEYQALAQHIELSDILLLADRVLTAFRDDPKFERVDRVRHYLGALRDPDSNPTSRSIEIIIEDLIKVSELWMKTLLWLVDKSKYEAKKSTKYFTLAPIMGELNLITFKEANDHKNNVVTITDKVKLECYYLSVRDRNHFTHDTANNDTTPDEYTRSILTSLLAPIYKHYTTIQHHLNGLLTHTITDESILKILGSVRLEQQAHLSKFKGRQDYLDTFENKLLINSTTDTESDARISHQQGKYYIISGTELMGKSALAAKLVDKISQQSDTYFPFDSEGIQLRRHAPWLPHVIYFTGKQSQSPYIITEALVAQINTLLMNPVSMQVPSTNKFTDHDTTQLTRAFNDEQQSKLTTQRNMLLGGGLNDESFTRNNTNDLRQILTNAMEKLVIEHGPKIVVIDALDEISPKGDNLEFLPKVLPTGITIIVTVRANSPAHDWIKRQQFPKEDIKLKGFSQDDIHEMYPADTDEKQKFAQRMLRESGGWPIIVSNAIAQATQTQQLATISISSDTNTIFAEYAREWEHCHGENYRPMMRDLLAMFATFHAVAPISLSLVQSFLQFSGRSLTQPDVKHLLTPIATKLEGLDNTLRLSLRAFGEYILTKYFSRKDRQDIIGGIITWLLDIVPHEPDCHELIAAFIKHYTTNPTTQTDGLIPTFESFVRTLTERCTPDDYYPIYRILVDDLSPIEQMSQYAQHLLKSAVAQQHPRAMTGYGNRLLRGVNLPQDEELGLNVLGNAAQLQNVESMLTLGSHALIHEHDGTTWFAQALAVSRQLERFPQTLTCIEFLHAAAKFHKIDYHHTIEAAFRWLVDHSYQPAELAYAEYLIDDEYDVAEGERLLRSLADDQYEPAMLALSTDLHIGQLTEAYAGESNDILQQLIDKNNTVAMRRMVSRLLGAESATQHDKDTALQLLKRACDTGDSKALMMYAVFLFNGQYNIPKDPKTARTYLQHAGEKGNVSALSMLGFMLISASSRQEQAEGLELLRSAAKKGDDNATRMLGAVLLDGTKHIKANKSEGEKWLRAAQRGNDLQACVSLGQRLVYGNNVKPDTTEGIQLLTVAAKRRVDRAHAILGDIYLNGTTTGIAEDIARGMDYLEEGVQHDNTLCQRSLAEILIEGLYQVPIDTHRGSALLQQAIDADDDDACVDMAIYLANGSLPRDMKRAEQLYRSTIAKDNNRARRLLAYQIINGLMTRIQADEEYLLLDKAAQADIQAKYDLGELLITKPRTPTDQQRGEALLRELEQHPEHRMRAKARLGNLIVCEYLPKPKGIGQQLLKEAMQLALKSRDVDASIIRLFYIANELAMVNTLVQHIYTNIDRKQLEDFTPLLFLLRRKELTYQPLPSWTDIVTPHVDLLGLIHRDPSMVINVLLYDVQHASDDTAWQKADGIFATFDEYEAIAFKEWWYDVMVIRKDDAEGHLVVAWLVRHELIADPDGITVTERITKARAGGWNVPAWFTA